MSKGFETLGTALDRDNYEWLVDENEDLAAALAAEVADGKHPNAIARFMLQHIGEDRRALVARCQSAARYLVSQKVKE